MSNNVNVVEFAAKPRTVSSRLVEETLDIAPTLTKYEVLIHLRKYYRYVEVDKDKLNEVTNLITDNLNKGYDFPVVPAHIYDDYVNLVIPNSLNSSEGEEAAFDLLVENSGEV